MRYLWEAIARDAISNTEVFCQFTRANETIVKANMQRVTKQSIVSQEQSASLNNINVNASLKQQRAVKAQEALYEGAIPINVAVAILIRRPSPNALDDACRYFCSCFQRPAWVERETEYAWLMWKQTLPITVGNLLAQPFPRRHVYLSDEAVAFTGCVMPRSVDETGFELITEEEGISPNPKNHFMLVIPTMPTLISCQPTGETPELIKIMLTIYLRASLKIALFSIRQG